MRFWEPATVLHIERGAAGYRWRVTCHIRRYEIETDHGVNTSWGRFGAREGIDSHIRAIKRDCEAVIRLGANRQGCLCKKGLGIQSPRTPVIGGGSTGAKQPASLPRKGLSTPKQRQIRSRLVVGLILGVVVGLLQAPFSRESASP